MSKRVKLNEDAATEAEGRDVFVEKLPSGITIKDVISLAREFGTVRMSYMFDYRDDCTYILSFDNESSAAEFVRSNPSVKGQPVTVSPYVNRDINKTRDMEYDHDTSQPFVSPDCLDLIFQYLDHMELVIASRTCKYWYNISTNAMRRRRHLSLYPTLTKLPKLRMPRKLTEKEFIKILKNTNLKSLDLSNTDMAVSDRVAQAIIDHCPDINKLIAPRCFFTKRLALTFFSKLPNVTYLILRGEEYDAWSFLEEQVLKTVLINCKSLKHLDIAQNGNVKGDCFDHLPSSLKYLNISNASFEMSKNIIAVISRRCPNLETLNISRLSSNIFPVYSHALAHGIVPQSDYQVVEVMPSLKSLRMGSIHDDGGWDNEASGVMFSYIFAKTPSLEFLDISGNILENDVMELLPKCCPNLKSLNIAYCSIQKVDRFMSALESLNLIELQCFYADREDTTTDQGLLEFERAVDSLTNFKQLKVLELAHDDLNNEHISRLILELPELEKLFLHRCKRVDNGLLTLLNANQSFNLKPGVLEFHAMGPYQSSIITEDFISNKIKLTSGTYFTDHDEPGDSNTKQPSFFNHTSSNNYETDMAWEERECRKDVNDEFEDKSDDSANSSFDDQDVGLGWYMDSD